MSKVNLHLTLTSKKKQHKWEKAKLYFRRKKRPLERLFVVFVAVDFLSQVIFAFLLFMGMVMYANEVETKEK